MDRRSIHDINPTPLEVGFSDEVLILISLLGFTFLFAALACLCHFSPSQAKFDENGGGGANGDVNDEDSYDKLLEDADVSTLNRAQRKARAKLLMKKKKKAAYEQQRGEAILPHEDNENEDANNNNNGGEAVDDNIHEEEGDNANKKRSSRKERQKAAKEEERLYRREYEEIRKLKIKEEKERREAKEIRLKQKKELMELERQEAIDEEINSWKYFFDDLTVDDFVGELQSTQVIDLNDIANRFSVSIKRVIERLGDLEQDGRINHGIIDKENNKYYFVSESDMKVIATFIKKEKVLSTDDIIDMVSDILDSKIIQNSSGGSKIEDESKI